MAVCLRCEWVGPLSADGRCSSCGVALYREGSRPVARVAGSGARLLEAEVVERPDEPPVPPPPAHRRWILPLALALVVGAALLLPRRDAPAPPERPGVANPPPPTTRFVGLPPGLSDRTVDEPVRLAFAATQPVPKGRSQLFQLWRLQLPTGELTPGPIVGDVLAIRYAPDGSGRLAFLVRGGALFVLDGFLGARPTWVDGGVTAFDFDRDGSLVYAKVVRRSAARGGAVTVVRLGEVGPGEARPGSLVDHTIRSLNVRGYTVRGDRFVAWGVRAGRERALTWRAGAARPRPAPGLDVTSRARSAAGFWVLDHPASPRGAPGDPAHLATSGELLLWSGGRWIEVVDRRGGDRWSVRLPARFPQPTGPVAAG